MNQTKSLKDTHEGMTYIYTYLALPTTQLQYYYRRMAGTNEERKYFACTYIHNLDVVQYICMITFMFSQWIFKM